VIIGCAFSLRRELGQGPPRASDKSVRTWPPVVAADAGPYANSIAGRNRVKVRRSCAAARKDMTPCGQKVVTATKYGVERG
jgi:hypothetical protein